MNEAACEKSYDTSETSEQNPDTPPVRFVLGQLPPNSSPKGSCVNHQHCQPEQKCWKPAFDEQLNRRRVKMADGKATAVKHIPLLPMRLDRIHTDAENEIPRTGRPKPVAIAPHYLPVLRRFVLNVKETDMPL